MANRYSNPDDSNRYAAQDDTQGASTHRRVHHEQQTRSRASSSSGSQHRRPAPQQPNKRKPPQKNGNGSNKKMFAILAAAVVVIAVVIAIVLSVTKSDDTSSVVSAPTAEVTEDATVEVTEDTSAEATDDTTAEVTEDTSAEATDDSSGDSDESTSLAELLGEDDSDLSGVDSVEVTGLDDLSVNEDLPEEWLNVLLLGSDERTLTENARTDSMIICSINLTTGEVKLTSIMRDLAVEYDDIGEYNGTYRINAANFFGGEELAMKVVNECFDMNIENYVRVNFYGFQQIAQMLGGIEMDITEEEMEEINYRIYEQAKAAYEEGIDESNLPNEYLETYGENTHLDGRQTLAYARIRKLDGGDYERTNRQRKVLVALLDKVKELSTSEMLSLANEALPYVTTNMAADTILAVALKVVQNGIEDVESLRLPVTGTYTQETRDGQDMLYDCDWDANASELYYFIYGD